MRRALALAREAEEDGAVTLGCRVVADEEKVGPAPN